MTTPLSVDGNVCAGNAVIMAQSYQSRNAVHRNLQGLERKKDRTNRRHHGTGLGLSVTWASPSREGKALILKRLPLWGKEQTAEHKSGERKTGRKENGEAVETGWKRGPPCGCLPMGRSPHTLVRVRVLPMGWTSCLLVRVACLLPMRAVYRGGKGMPMGMAP